MYKIICDFCGKENIFSDPDKRPAHCSNPACQNSLNDLEMISIEGNSGPAPEAITGIKLIYQKTSEEIILGRQDEKIILGRENYGKEILAGIPQISRSHCSIEINNNEVTVCDMGSTNGTFVGLGTGKLSCTTGRILKENDFLSLGREVFLVLFIRNADVGEATPVLNSTTAKPKEILCTSCSFILHELPCICPECGTWNE